MNRITTACLDMAGTTVADDGTVMAAFTAALEQFGLSPGASGYDEAAGIVHETMGQSKIEVFRRILGDEASARKANESFENHYAAAVRRVRGPRAHFYSGARPFANAVGGGDSHGERQPVRAHTRCAPVERLSRRPGRRSHRCARHAERVRWAASGRGAGRRRCGRPGRRAAERRQR